MSLKNCFILIIFLLVISGQKSLKAQIPGEFQQQEDTLVKMGTQLWKTKSDSVKLLLNEKMTNKLMAVLSSKGAFEYPFDSLKGISKLKDKDSRFRLFTWNVPLSEGFFHYNGILLTEGGKIVLMKSGESKLTGFPKEKIPLDQWYGAIYYSLVEKSYNHRTYYTLLGWDGHNATSNFKIIDILSFDDSGTPFLGEAVFKTKEGLKSRVLIEYAENANALLRYDYQKLMVQKGRRTREVPEWMIVMDRLAPMDPSLTGIGRFYVPAGDTYDAYIFKEGYWVLAEDIMVENPTLQAPGKKAKTR